MPLIYFLGILFWASLALPCAEDLVAQASPFGAYERIKEWPKLSTRSRRRTAVLVGSRMNPLESFQKAFKGDDLFPDPNFPVLPHRIFGTAQVPDKKKLADSIELIAQHFEVIIFAMHSNPYLIEVNPTFNFLAEDFRNLKLNQNILVFAGCNVGNTKMHQEGRLSILDTLMQTTNAYAVLGSTNFTHHMKGSMKMTDDDGRLHEHTFNDDPVVEEIHWFMTLEGGRFASPPKYRPTWDLGDLDLGDGTVIEAPPLDVPDPIEYWRVLRRITDFRP